MADSKSEQIGRLAFREQGNNWNAYYALTDTLDGALHLGSIKMGAVADNPQRKQAFMDLMRDVVADTIEQTTGKRPTWNKAQAAPEHERARAPAEQPQSNRSVDRAALDRASNEFTAMGKLIEAGWIGLRLAAIPLDTPPAQLDDMRIAFFSGAQHLFGSLMTILDPGEEPTDADLKRMDLIDAELRAFLEDFKLRHIKTKGRA
jgi:hypothetical protein